MQQENLAPLPGFKMESYKTLCNYQGVAEQIDMHLTQTLSQTNWSSFQHSNELIQQRLYGSPFPYGSGVVPNTISLSIVQTHSFKT